MIANYIVNTANHWMASRAFEEDAWDRRLEKWNDSSPLLIFNIGIIGAQLLIKLTRIIFKFLYLFNLRVTRWMSREMEYDADRYECWISGSGTFKEVAIALRKMGMADRHLIEVGKRAWNEGHLIENIPVAIATIADQLTSEDVDLIQCQMEETQTNVWDTHPADNDRINHAELHDFDAVWLHEFPASELMPQFDKLCKIVTLRQFNQWGIDSPERYVKPYSEIDSVISRQAESEYSLDIYFGNLFTMRLMNLPSSVSSVDDVSHIVSQISNNYLSKKSLVNAYWEHHNKLMNLNLAITYLEAGYQIEPDKFGLSSSDLGLINAELKRTFENFKLAETKLSREFDCIMLQRIKFAIENMPAESKQKAVDLYNSLRQFELLKDIWSAHYFYLQRLQALLEDDEEQQPKAYAVALKEVVERNIEFIRQFQHISSVIKLQFDSAKGQSLKAFSLSWGVGLDEEPGSLGAASICEISDGCARVMRFTYHRTVAELALYCHELEEKRLVKPIRVPKGDSIKE